MMRLLLFFLLPFSVLGQEIVRALPKELKEISGLVFVKDDLMVGINDSGNTPTLFFINVKGDVLHKAKLTDAENVDWEDITFDGKDQIFISDAGNNQNKRKDLCVYVVSLKEALDNEHVSWKKIQFSYPDQKDFPAKKEDQHFDCEAIAYYKDSLYLFTKSRAEPWNGISYVYTLDVKSQNQKANLIGQLYVGKNGWWQDAITAVDIRNDVCYLLTYNRLMKYNIVKRELVFDQWVYLTPITQKESVAVNSKGEIFVADEEQTALGGGFLYKVKFPLKTKKRKK